MTAVTPKPRPSPDAAAHREAVNVLLSDLQSLPESSIQLLEVAILKHGKNRRQTAAAAVVTAVAAVWLEQVPGAVVATAAVCKLSASKGQ